MAVSMVFVFPTLLLQLIFVVFLIILAIAITKGIRKEWERSPSERRKRLKKDKTAEKNKKTTAP